MNYYKPRQGDPNADRPDAGKWRYTRMNDGRVWRVGYCAQDCAGHDTREGAYEHQTQYLLDNALRLDGRYVDTQFKCEVCGVWTDRFGEVDHRDFALCDEHRTREQVAQLFGTVGDAISSW